MEAPPNLILLSIDALRADHTSSQGYDRKTTPSLDVFADENIQFTRAFAPSSHTREAAPPLLTGLWPETFAANNFQQVEETLPVRLHGYGYHTGAFHSNPYLSRAYGYDDGFEQFYDDLYLARNKFIALAQKALDKYVFNKGEYYARADEINSRALNWIDSLDGGPFFLWNHYMDVHGPYHAPERQFADRSLSASEAETLYRKSWERPEDITAEERQLLRDSYDDEIRYLDAKIDSFLESLRERDLLSESVIVITSDHGEVFGEHGQYTHPRQLHDQLLHVPLLVSTPGGESATVDTPVSTLDVAPTFAAAAGTDIEHLPGQRLLSGPNLADMDPDRRVFASVALEGEDDIRRFAVRTRNKLLRQERTTDSNETVTEDLDDISDSNDDATAESSPTVESLRSELADFARDRLRDLGSIDPESDPETTAEIESRLEALGYK